MSHPAARLVACAALVAVALGACSAKPTEIVVAVNTDLAVPTEIDVLFVRIDYQGKTKHEVPYDLTSLDAVKLPATLAVVGTKDTVDPVLIIVEGRRGATLVVSRRARVPFARERVLLLRMNLLRSCAYITCGAEESCENGVCRPIAVDPSSLPAYTDTEAFKRFEAGVRREAGGDGPRTDGPVRDHGPDRALLDGARDQGVQLDKVGPTVDAAKTDGGKLDKGLKPDTGKNDGPKPADGPKPVVDKGVSEKGVSDKPVGTACSGSGTCSDPMKPLCLLSVCSACWAAGLDYGLGGGDYRCAMEKSPLSLCDTSGACVQCKSSSHCGGPGGTPICDGTSKACRKCLTAVECKAGYPVTPVCGASGTCVECAASADCVSPTKPICNLVTSTCAACATDGECAAKGALFCDGGSCAAATDGVYANAGATCGSANGTASAPFCTLPDAVNGLVGGQRYVFALSDFTLTSTLPVNNREVRLRSLTGAKIKVLGAPCPLLQVNGSTAKLWLGDVAVLGGINVINGGFLGSYRAEIGPSTCYGVRVNPGSGDLRRTKIHQNTSGGLDLTLASGAPPFKLYNNLIVKNGSAASSFGGMTLAVQMSMGQIVDMAFCTIADNQAKVGAVGGVAGSFYMSPTGRSCIVWGNSGHQVEQNSPWYASDIDDPVGTPWYSCTIATCIQQAPLFKAGDADYHLDGLSPCINTGKPESVTEDFDGTPRSATPTMGAQE